MTGFFNAVFHPEMVDKPAPSESQAGDNPGIFNAVFHPKHEYSGASYQGARAARQGGVTPGTWRPERPATFKA